MNTITYKLKPVEMNCYSTHEGQTNVVFSVAWAYSCTDGTNTVSLNGRTPITYQTNASFTAYSEITQDQVVEWVTAAWGPGLNTAYQTQLDSMLEIAPRPMPLPWSQHELVNSREYRVIPKEIP